MSSVTENWTLLENHNNTSSSSSVVDGIMLTTSSPSRKSASSTNNSNRMLLLVSVAAATAATLGYDVGIMAAAIQPLEQEMQLSSVQKEVAMGSLNFVAAAGALLGGTVANRHGRKPTVTLCCWLFVAGTLCMACAPNYAFLLVGRIVTGLGVGVSFVAAPVYLSEVAPAQQRGQVNTVFDVAINGGILMGYLVGFLVQVMPLPDVYKWRVMLGLGLLLPILVLCFLSMLPESPRWLVMDNQSPAALQVLEQLGQCSSQQEALQTVASIEEEFMIERREAEAAEVALSTSSSNKCWKPSFSSGTKLAISLGFWQQVTGTEAVLYYSADFLDRAGLESTTQRLLGNVLVGLCKLVPELLAMRVVDQVGRRPLMLGSAVALVLATASLAVAFWLSWSPIVIVIFLCAIMAAFSAGLGPFTFLVASESLGLRERATGMTLCAAANRCTSGAVALTAVSLYEALGDAGFFTFYALVGVASLAFYYRAVPETTGQTLEELAARARGGGNRGSPAAATASSLKHLSPCYSNSSSTTSSSSSNICCDHEARGDVELSRELS